MKLLQRITRFHKFDYSYSGVFLLGFAYFLISSGHGIFRATFHNYAIESFNVEPQEIGFIFSLMAVPGLFSFVVGLVSQRIILIYLIFSTFFLLSFGLIALGQPSERIVLWVGPLSISMGFTFFYPIVHTLCLIDGPFKSATKLLGKLKSYSPLAALFSSALIVYSIPLFGLRVFYIISGTVILVIGVFLSFVVSEKYLVTKMLLRFRFSFQLWRYYALNFLNGCRSSIFKAFVLYLMIHEYHFEIKGTALIVLVGNILNFCGYRLIGPLIERFGIKKTLSFVYIGVALIFLGFCVAKKPPALAILFWLDSLFFCSSVATDSFLKDKVIEKELIGYLSSGVSFFYIAGIIAPYLGGVLWKFQGYQATFLLGCTLALIAVAVIRKIQIA